MCIRGGRRLRKRGAPSLLTLGGGGFGFQIGAKVADVVFLVMKQKGAQKLLQDKIKLGADASVAATLAKYPLHGGQQVEESSF